MPGPEASFARARELKAQGHHQAACALFRSSHTQEPTLGTLLNLADCTERLGQHAEAFRLFNEASGWARRDRDAKRAQIAKDRSSALRSILTFLSVELSTPTPGAVAEVWSPTGSPIARWQLEVPQTIPLDVGPYRLRVESAGKVSAEVDFEVAATPGLLRLLVPPLETVTRPEPAPIQPKPVRSLAIGAIAVGASIIITSGVLLALAENVFQGVRRQQVGGPDELKPSVTRSEFLATSRLAPWAWGALLTGVALAGAGVIGLLWPDRHVLKPLLALAPDGLAVVVQSRF